MRIIDLELDEFLEKVEEAAYNGYKRATEEEPLKLITKSAAMKMLGIGYTKLEGLVKKGTIKLVGKKVIYASVMDYANSKP